MTIDIRQASHPDAVRRYDTAQLRRHFDPGRREG